MKKLEVKVNFTDVEKKYLKRADQSFRILFENNSNSIKKLVGKFEIDRDYFKNLIDNLNDTIINEYQLGVKKREFVIEKILNIIDFINKKKEF